MPEVKEIEDTWQIETSIMLLQHLTFFCLALTAVLSCIPSAYIRTGLAPSWPAEESPSPLVLAVVASAAFDAGKHSSVSAATVRQSAGREQGMSVTCLAWAPVFALFTMLQDRT